MLFQPENLQYILSKGPSFRDSTQIRTFNTELEAINFIPNLLSSTPGYYRQWTQKENEDSPHSLTFIVVDYGSWSDFFYIQKQF